MGIQRTFTAQHGSRERRTDMYTIELVIKGPIESGFVASVDYTQPCKCLEETTSELEGAYLDDIVGRATNENIAQFFLFRLSESPVFKIRLTEGSDCYVEIHADEFDKAKYPAQLAFNKGHSLLLREEPELAVAYFTEAIGAEQEFAQAYNLRGRCLKYLRDFKAALADFRKAVQINPDFGEAWRNIGNAYLYLGNYEEMIPAFDRAVDLMPDSALAINNRGYGYFMRKEYEQALNDHTKAIQIDPNYAEAHYDKAMALKATGQRRLALASLLEARRLRTSGQDTFHGIKMY
jgi:tetratricopeptide (TPR) repeat protein